MSTTPMPVSTFTSSMFVLLAVTIGSGLTVGSVLFKSLEARKIAQNPLFAPRNRRR